MKSVVPFLLVALAVFPLTFLAHADPTSDGEVLPSVNDGGTEPPASGYAPDPAPLVTRHYWSIDLRYRSGTLIFGGVSRVDLPAATPSARMMGRFAIELYVGHQLLDRVRFDFPLLGADDFASGARRWDSPPSFEKDLATKVAILIPQSDRATRAILVDRATGRAWMLPWPFVPRAPRADAGGSDR